MAPDKVSDSAGSFNTHACCITVAPRFNAPADNYKLQLDELLKNTNRALYTFSTWPNSSSTGVARPKIVTETRTRDFS